MLRLATIGLGARVALVLTEMRKIDPEVELVAVADPDLASVNEKLRREGMPRWANVRLYDNADALLEHAEQYDALMIGTRCNLHTPMAVKVAPLKLPLFLEKPVAISEEQLGDLARAFHGREDSVVVSFPLRMTPLFRAARQIVQCGRLGTINQVQAFNNVPYGGVYFGEWYRNYPEVGGLWLQKATHDFDAINRLLDVAPTRIAATITRKVYGGDKPHDLRCSKCDETATCPESPQQLRRRGDGGGMGMDDHWCAFSKEIRNEDAGAAMIQYADGTHASYAQNFISRRSAGTRGALVTGYDASLRFDWYTDQITVIDHHADSRVDRIEVEHVLAGHMGGDTVLCRMFLDVVRGKSKSQSTLGDGLLSAAMCLAARRSSHANTFERIPTVEEIAGAAVGT